MIKWFFVIFFELVSIFLYFFIAKKYGIIDKPNERSSHTEPVIRGGGVVFYFAAFLYFFVSSHQYLYFFLGLSTVVFISFWDDIKSLPNRVRLLVHFASILLLLYQLGAYANANLAIVALVVVLCIGILNAYNFMDGINGLTGLYSLVGLATVLFLNFELGEFIDSDLVIYVIIACLIFIFFNFRKKASCFSGDVGSFGMAFIMIFFISKLIIFKENPKYIFLLFLYGLDTIYTLLFRLLKGENIFKAHRSHFFQILVHQYNLPHLVVSLLYALVQLGLNVWIVFFEFNNFIFFIPFIVLLLFMEYFRSLKNLSISSIFMVPINKN
jgi:UDP-GlcNAc:undecaprenyl-phosphate GlcNAc-1-phosphate transferase